MRHSPENSTTAINAEILNVLRSIKTKSFRARVVNDSLAVGEMVMFRNDSGTLLVREPVLPIVTIVPMSALPLLGREISWSDRGCYVRHPSQGLLPVRLRDGTPELPALMVLWF